MGDSELAGPGSAKPDFIPTLAGHSLNALDHMVTGATFTGVEPPPPGITDLSANVEQELAGFHI